MRARAQSGLLPQPGDEQDASSDSETSSGVSTSSEEEDVVTGGQAAPPKQRRASQSKQKRKTKKDRGRKGKSSKKILKEKAASVQWVRRVFPVRSLGRGWALWVWWSADCGCVSTCYMLA